MTLNIYTVNMLMFLVITSVIPYCDAGIFSWLFRSYSTDNMEDEHKFETEFITPTNREMESSSDVIISAKIPFEISGAEEKFLAEASHYTSIQLSDLDICHHKIIIGLKKTCSELTEEELAKVSVNLLNCQSAAEGRPIYSCTSSMLLYECTKPMDQDTWNAYHIVSNRARAVCYQFRQQQFRFKTEMTVNKLMLSAEGQMNTMRELEESHSNLKDVTAETLNNLSSGQTELQKKQSELFSAHHTIHHYVSSNLRDLSRERKVISSGQKELSQITMVIKDKLEEAQIQLKGQGDGQRSFHEQIINDLAAVQNSANKIWQELDESIVKIIEINEKTAIRNNQLLQDLDKMNATVHHLLGIVNTMKTRLEEKFSWITSMLGDTDETVQKIYSFSVHLSYFLSSVVIASFLQVPYVTRVALLVSVPLNALSELQSGQSLQFSTLTAVLVLSLVFDLSGKALFLKYKTRQTSINASNSFLSIAYSSRPVSADSSLKSNPTSANNSRTSLGDYSSEEENSPSKNDFQWSKPSNWYKQIVDKRLNHPKITVKEEKDNETLKTNGVDLANGSNLNNLGSDQTERSCDVQSVRRHLLHQINEVGFDSSKFSLPSASRRNINLEESVRNCRSRSSTPIDGRSPSRLSSTPKILCSSICKSGMLCKNSVSGNSDMCFRHLHGSRESTPHI